MDDKKTHFLQQLGECSGNVSGACDRVGITRQLYYYWRKQSPDFAEQCDIVIGSCKASRREKKQQEREERRARCAEAQLIIDGGETATAGISDSDGGIPDDDTAALRAAQEGQFAEDLRAALRDRNLYRPWVEPQVRAAAKLMLAVSILGEEATQSSPVLTEMSREGDTRNINNPVFENLRRHIDTLTGVLKSLGLNFDAKVAEPEHDGFKELMERLNADD